MIGNIFVSRYLPKRYPDNACCHSKVTETTKFTRIPRLTTHIFLPKSNPET